jgi:hypothetical protein
VWQQTNATTFQKISHPGLVCDGGAEALHRALPLLPELSLEQFLQRLAQVLEQVPSV